MSAIDLSRLPAPNAVDELDYTEIRDEILADFAAANPDLADLAPSDPAYAVAEVAAYRELMQRQRHNDKARAVMLAYATGPDLDHIAATYYWTERHDGESDESLKERCQVAPSQPSTAGSTEGYIAVVRAAHEDVKDVIPLTRSAGIVALPILSREGDGTPSQDVLDAVDAAVQDQQNRPLNDRPTVSAATIKTFSLDATLTVGDGPDADLVIQRATDAVRDYVDERHRLGQDIVVDALRARLYVEGVERVSLSSPEGDILCTDEEAPYCESVEVTVG